MVYSIHSDKRGFYYKLWQAESDYPHGRPCYEAKWRHDTEDAAACAADRHIDEANDEPVGIGESAFAYIKWVEEYQRINRVMTEHLRKREDIRAACPHNFYYEPRSIARERPTRRCIACRKEDLNNGE